MTPDAPKPTVWERSTICRFFKWLFTRRTLTRVGFLLVAFLTLIALLYTVENWRGRRAWNQYRQYLLAQAEQLDPKAFIPPPVPDDQNFAMTPFLAPVLDIDYRPVGIRRWRDTNGYQRAQNFAADFVGIKESWMRAQQTDLGAWLAKFQKQKQPKTKTTNAPAEPPALSRSQAAPAVLQALQEYEPVLQEIRTAARRPLARYNLGYDEQDPWSLLLPHLAVIKHIASVLTVRASALLAAGKPDAGFEEVQVLLTLGDTLKNEPLLISQLVRFACLKLALQVVWEGLADHQWSDPQLQALQARFERADFIKDMSRAVRAERAFNCSYLELLRDQPPKRSMLLTIGNDSSTANSKFGAFLLRLVPSGWINFEIANLNRTYQDFLAAAWKDQKFIDPAASDQQMARFEQSIGSGLYSIRHHCVLTKIFFPALGKLARRTAQVQAMASEAALACALERCRLGEGGYPERLEALVPRFIPKLPHDTVVAEPFKYKRASDGHSFLLYSVGWNLRDDGGVPVFRANQGQPEFNEGDWVWNSAKTNERVDESAAE